MFATIFLVVPSLKPFSKESQRQEFSRRLRDELLRSGRTLSPSALAREINLNLRPSEQIHPSSCRKWLHGEAFPTQEKLLRLSRILQVSPAWLRFGQTYELHEPGPYIPPLKSDELALLEHWRHLGPSQRRAVRLLVGQLLKSSG